MSMAMMMDVAVEKWRLEKPVRITGYTFVEIDLLVLSLTHEGRTGRGEAAGVYYRNDNVSAMLRQIESARAAIESGVDREELQRLLPPGGARNALDCALWDLEAKLTGKPVWQLAGLSEPKPLLTTFTLGADAAAVMADNAREIPRARAIKLKLTGDAEDAERVRAVRLARPDVFLAVDANQGFTRASLEALMPTFIATDVRIIEQPVAIGREAELEGLRSPIPIAADESAQNLRDLAGMVGRFQMINIKLDKCGGLTEGLAMARAARELGLETMVGNMGGTSLAMAPAFLVGQFCEIVDLDGPTIYSSDRELAARYEDGHLWCPEEVWGGREAGGAHGH